MNRIKCIAITVFLIIGPLSFSVAGEVKIPAEKVEAFTVDSVTGSRTDLVFNRRSHRWEVPISSLERAINPLAVKMPESFFVKDPTTGSIYPVRWEPYHQYVWGMDDRSSDLKNPPVKFIADYYPPGEYTPPGGWPYPSEGGVSPPNSPAKSPEVVIEVYTETETRPQSQWQIPTFRQERKAKREREKERAEDVPSGAVNPQTGEYYPPTGKGAFDPKTGTYFPPTGRGYFNPRTGEFYPSTGKPKEKKKEVDTETRPQSQWQIPTRGESVDESQWQIPVFKRRR